MTQGWINYDRNLFFNRSLLLYQPRSSQKRLNLRNGQIFLPYVLIPSHDQTLVATQVQLCCGICPGIPIEADLCLRALSNVPLAYVQLSYQIWASPLQLNWSESVTLFTSQFTSAGSSTCQQFSWTLSIYGTDAVQAFTCNLRLPLMFIIVIR